MCLVVRFVTNELKENESSNMAVCHPIHLSFSDVPLLVGMDCASGGFWFGTSMFLENALVHWGFFLMPGEIIYVFYICCACSIIAHAKPITCRRDICIHLCIPLPPPPPLSFSGSFSPLSLFLSLSQNSEPHQGISNIISQPSLFFFRNLSASWLTKIMWSFTFCFCFSTFEKNSFFLYPFSSFFVPWMIELLPLSLFFSLRKNCGRNFSTRLCVCMYE